MRIAHFVHRYPPAPGGAEAYFARLSRALVEAGHQVTVFTSNALDLQAFWSRRGRRVPAGKTVEEGVEVRRYPLCHLPAQRYLLRALSLIPLPRWQAWTVSCTPLLPSLFSDCGRINEDFELIHAAAFPYTWPLLCAQRLAERLKVPFLLSPFVHLGDLAVPGNRIRRIYTQPALLQLARSATRIFVQTQGERQALQDKGIDANRLVLQGMGITPEVCTGGRREQTRRQWGVGSEDVVIGHLANLSQEKGTVDLLRAADLAWEQGGRFELVLAGASMANFQRFWKGLARAARVRLLGELSDEAKRDFFAAIDVFALPSRVDSFGLVLLEAWANGLPTIGYRAGGIPWVIRDEVDGLLTPCGDLKALAGALLRLAADPDLRHRFGQTGQKRVQGELHWNHSLEIVKQTYDSVAGMPAGCSPEAISGEALLPPR
jgi:glycosyltransferase involved in cell wall biosynthesis